MTIAGAPSRFQFVAFEEESSFGAIAAFSSPTRIEVIDVVDTSGLTQEKVTPEGVYQRPNDGRPGFLGKIGGEVTISKYLTGHGGTAVGALTETDLFVLLEAAIGSGDSASVGDAASGSPTTTSIPTTSGDFANSTLCRVGELGDGRAEGQWAAVTSEAANTLTLSTALPAAPNSGDDVAAALVVHPSSNPCEPVNSLRLQIVTPNGQYECFGCFAKAVSFTGLNPGEVPRVSITYGVAHWRTPTSPITFPSTVATDEKEAIVVGGGSFFLQALGTSTRATYTLRSLEIAINLEILEQTGYGGDHAQQTILGALIVGNSMTMTATFDKPAAGTETFDDLWLQENAEFHVLAGLSVTDGRALAFYLQNASIVGNRPTQRDLEGANRVTLELQSHLVNDTAASALDRADWMLGMA